MYCRKCGKKIPDDSSFCSACGEKILDISSKELKKQEYNENNKNCNNLFTKFRQSTIGEIILVLLFGVVGIIGIGLLYVIGSVLLEKGHTIIVALALALGCDFTFAWLAYDYAKKEEKGKAIYAAIMLIIMIFCEIFLGSMMF